MEFTAQIDAATKKTYRGDPVRLAQVLNNLVSNAIKFTAAGVVNVAVSVEQTSETIDLVRFSVKDKGKC